MSRSKIKSAKVYEYLLWLIFLSVVFLIGFFHGSSPEKQINFYYQDVKKIDILVQQQNILPYSFIKYLEKETHSQVNIVTKTTYKDFRTEIIVNKNLLLIASPESFIEPLVNDNRIRNIDSLAEFIQKSVHSDFQPARYDTQIYSLPIAWFVNVFSLSQKNSSAVYIDNVFLLNQKQKNHFFQFNKNYDLEKSWTNTLKNTDIFETTLQLASKNNKAYEIDPNSSFLMTYSLAIPNTTPDRALSMEFLRLILLSRDIKTTLTENELGQTFLNPREEYSIAHFVAPDSIRNLNLNNFKNANKTFDESLWSDHSLKK